MVEAIIGICGALAGLIGGVAIAYGKIKAINYEHAEKMKALETDRDIKLAEAEAKLKTAEDQRQNEAFDRLKQSFDTLQQMFNDLLIRTQNLESSEKACQERVTKLTQEMAELKKG
jgi:predicted outer membrane lipoprotein